MLKPESTRPRILFCSYHSYLDPSSGAAISTQALLEMMVAHGWECATFSGPQLDFEDGTALEKVLRSEKLPFQHWKGSIFQVPCTLYRCERNGVAHQSFVPARANAAQPPTKQEGQAFLSLAMQRMNEFQPEVLLTYGGQWLTPELIRCAKRRNIKVVFSLHNLAYTGADLFCDVDAILVPSEATREHYESTLGLTQCTAIPGPFNWSSILCDRLDESYVTFVNPQPGKGVFWFARIAYELYHRRPEIPFLVVEGRGKSHWLVRSDLDLKKLKNLNGMANTPDPRRFYRLSRMLLVPSLHQETFGRVAAEASMNGIPVLASNRGGLPEALAGAGFLFDIPERYSPESRETPTAEEVEPWIEIIERLWDDDNIHSEESERARQAAEAWRPERLWSRFEDFFHRLVTSE